MNSLSNALLLDNEMCLTTSIGDNTRNLQVHTPPHYEQVCHTSHVLACTSVVSYS